MRSAPHLKAVRRTLLACGAILAFLVTACAGAESESSGTDAGDRERITSLQTEIANVHSSKYSIANVTDKNGKVTVSVVGDAEAARRELTIRFPEHKIVVLSSQGHHDLVGRVPSPSVKSIG